MEIWMKEMEIIWEKMPAAQVEQFIRIGRKYGITQADQQKQFKAEAKWVYTNVMKPAGDWPVNTEKGAANAKALIGELGARFAADLLEDEIF